MSSAILEDIQVRPTGKVLGEMGGPNLYTGEPTAHLPQLGNDV